MGGKDEIIDMTKLSQRELLIRISDKQETMSDSLKKLSEEYTDLHDRMIKIEERNRITAVLWSLGASGVATTIMNIILKLAQ
jgi:Mg2+ and Co2+ transporter CorA